MRNAVLIVIDTLRSDALDHARTPNIDALVARGQLGQLVWSSDTWTGGSVVSLFTGRHVRNHGWIQSFPGSKAKHWDPMPELPDVPILAEVLRDAGFDTAGYYANRVLSWDLGFDRGFARWEFAEDQWIPGHVAEEVTMWRDDERNFLYLHFMGTHTPLTLSPQAQRRWKLGRSTYGSRRKRTDPDERAAATDEYRRAYWAAVEDIDAKIGLVVRFLEPHMDDTVVVLTSDHGEMLGERDLWGHGRYMYESLTRVPFVAVNTEPLPARFNNAVTADLITRALGVDHDWSLEVGVPELLVAQYRKLLAISPDGRAKGVWDQRGALEVYDLEGYPEESPGHSERSQELAKARTSFEEAVKPGKVGPKRIAADPEMLEELRALGYLADGDEDASR